jgi:hypothetical protein
VAFFPLVNIRGEGWKEVKVGCLFRVVERACSDRKTGDLIEKTAAVDKSYVAHLGGPESFCAQIFDILVRVLSEGSPKSLVALR